MDHHHVIYRQKIRAKKGDEWDPDDGLTLCQRCHARHHRSPYWKLPLAALREENIAFAFALLGAAAYDYLTRRYSGEDPRVTAALESLHDPVA